MECAPQNVRFDADVESGKGYYIKRVRAGGQRGYAVVNDRTGYKEWFYTSGPANIRCDQLNGKPRWF